MKKQERIEGFLVAAAVADAMAGPHHGRNSAESLEFLDQGGWIDSFHPYTVFHQHHRSICQMSAIPGTFTADSRFRHLLVDAIIVNELRFPGSRMSPNYLAMSIVIHYRTCFIEYDQLWQRYRQAGNTTTKDHLLEKCKESFVRLWFAWELTQTATDVYLPQTLPLFSPPAIRINQCTDAGAYTGNWDLEPIDSESVTQSIKQIFHEGNFERGEEMPLGLIGLLPLAIYWTGNPRAAYRYILEMDFFDIGEANLYAAVFGALLSDLLGGIPWSQIVKYISHNSIQKFIAEYRNPGIQRIQRDFELAIAISQEFHHRVNAGERNNDIAFIKALHERFVVSEVRMGSVEELFSVAVALMEYAGHDLPLMIELGVNYGRENGVISALAASLAGAANGISAIPHEWRKTVEQARPACNFLHMAKTLADIEFD